VIRIITNDAARKVRLLVLLSVIITTAMIVLLGPSCGEKERSRRVCALQLACINEAKGIYYAEFGHAPSIFQLMDAGFISVWWCDSVNHAPNVTRRQAMYDSYVFDPELQVFVCKNCPAHTKQFLRRQSKLRDSAKRMIRHVRAQGAAARADSDQPVP
jgi:hypothetical protein